jgi:hypothetical protein
MRYDESLTRDKLIEIFEQQVREERNPKVFGEKYQLVPAAHHPYVEFRCIDENEELPKELQGTFTDHLTAVKVVTEYLKGRNRTVALRPLPPKEGVRMTVSNKKLDRIAEHKARMLAEFQEQLTGVRVFGDWVIKRRAGYSLYGVSKNGQTPRELEGWYTSFAAAEQAIREYEERKDSPKGPLPAKQVSGGN